MLNIDRTMQEYWKEVEEVLPGAHLIAWDTCHKIYIALNEREAEWFRANPYETFHGTPEQMRYQLFCWYEQSCPLRFIISVTHIASTAGYTTLIPQGAGHEYEAGEDWDDDEDDED